MHLLGGGSKQGTHGLMAIALSPLCFGAIAIAKCLQCLSLLYLGAQAELCGNSIHTSDVQVVQVDKEPHRLGLDVCLAHLRG